MDWVGLVSWVPSVLGDEGQDRWGWVGPGQVGWVRTGGAGVGRVGWVLTVLGDEGQAAVHDDGDVAPAQLLLPQGVSSTARRLLDVPIPQVEVGPGQALQVERSERGDRGAA